jgi:predicted amidophosphoribosyltransferase
MEEKKSQGLDKCLRCKKTMLLNRGSNHAYCSSCLQKMNSKKRLSSLAAQEEDDLV